MNTWITFALYEATWFAAIYGATHNWLWPALLGLGLSAVYRCRRWPDLLIELRLAVLAVVIGMLLDGSLRYMGWLQYANASPALFAPLWILALWASFALSLRPLLQWLYGRQLLSAVLGALGGPLAYIAAAHSAHAVRLVDPAWRGLMLLALGWALALPLLLGCARRWSDRLMEVTA